MPRPRSPAPLPLGILAGAFAGLMALQPAAARAQTADGDFWVTDGYIKALSVSGGVVYVGGSFDHVGPPTGGAAVVDTSTGRALKPYPQVLGIVRAVASDGNGGFYIGGDFTYVAGQPRRDLAHLDATGNLTAWAPATDTTVRAIAVNGNTVYVGGDFTTVGGVSRSHVAAIDGTTGAVAGWDPGVSGAGEEVRALAIVAQTHFPFTVTIYIGGSFTDVGGQTRYNVAAVDGGGSVLAWDPVASNEVETLGMTGGVLYMGGQFLTVASVTRHYAAAVDASTGALTSWDPEPDYFVHTLVAIPSAIYLGGEFSHVGASARLFAAAVDPVAGTPTSWDPEPNGVLYAMSYGPGVVYMGGSFYSSLGGQERVSIGAVDATSGTATGWYPTSDDVIYAVATYGDRVCVGGRATTIGGVIRHNVAALDLLSGLPTSWDPDADGAVECLLATGNSVYAGGSFLHVGGQARGRLAALDRTTGVPLSWDPEANGTVHALALVGPVIYAGGDFSAVGGQPHSCLAAIDTLTGAVTAWSPEANGSVYALTVEGGTLYAGGSFTIVAAHTRPRIAALDAATGTATAWSPDADGPVYAIAVSGSRVYLGGQFQYFGSSYHPYLAAFDAPSDTALAWGNPYLLTSGVDALALARGSLYAGGYFSTVPAYGTRNYLAAFDTTSGQLTPWAPVVDGVPYALAAPGPVIAAGLFASGGAEPRRNLAKFSDPYAAAVGPPVTAVTAGLRSEPNPFRGETRLRFVLPRSEAAEATVYDLGGREIRRFPRRMLPAGGQSLVWDGRDDAGREVGAGLYLARVRGDALDLRCKLFRLR